MSIPTRGLARPSPRLSTRAGAAQRRALTKNVVRMMSVAPVRSLRAFRNAVSSSTNCTHTSKRCEAAHRAATQVERTGVGPADLNGLVRGRSDAGSSRAPASLHSIMRRTRPCIDHDHRRRPFLGAWKPRS
eukprot:363878-Chlamydomonas_euryale.AAC.3